MAESLTDEDRLSAVEELLLKLFLGGAARDIVERASLLQRLNSSFSDNTPLLLLPQLRAWDQSHLSLERSFPDKDLRDKIDSLDNRLRDARLEQLEILLVVSQNPVFAQQRFNRAVPLSIYISGADRQTARELEDAVRALSTAAGLEIAYDGPIQVGSWYKDLIAKTKKALTSKEVQDNLGKVDRALTLKHIDAAQAKADLDLSKAAKNVHGILAKEQDAVVVIGSLCGIKSSARGGAVVIVALTQEQLLEISNNPHLRRNPLEMFELLDRSRSANIEVSENEGDASLKDQSAPRVTKARAKRKINVRGAAPSAPPK